MRDQTPGGPEIKLQEALRSNSRGQPLEDKKEPKRSTSRVKKEAPRSTS